jgi:glucose uptake protein GlcU
MVPTIGVMIGAYIFTRMLELCMNPTVSMTVKLFAVITMLIAGFGAAGLFVSGTTAGLQAR